MQCPLATHPGPPDDPLLLYSTSGTTSRPKLVERTQASYPGGHLATMSWPASAPMTSTWTSRASAVADARRRTRQNSMQETRTGEPVGRRAAYDGQRGCRRVLPRLHGSLGGL